MSSLLVDSCHLKTAELLEIEERPIIKKVIEKIVAWFRDGVKTTTFLFSGGGRALMFEAIGATEDDGAVSYITMMTALNKLPQHFMKDIPFSFQVILSDGRVVDIGWLPTVVAAWAETKSRVYKE
jgi:hypothetical protein